MRCVTNCSRLRRANCKPNKPGVTRLEPLYAKEQPRLYSVQSFKGGVRDSRKLQKRQQECYSNRSLSAAAPRESLCRATSVVQKG